MKLEDRKISFINKGNIKHTNKYNYSKIIYKNDKTKVIIVCPYHGDFSQTPNSHKAGAGCPHCSIEKEKLRKLKDTDYFIAESIKIHGNTYDYSETIYKSSKEKLEIGCKIHGRFTITPNHHLSLKRGCPKCYNSFKEKESLFYIIKPKKLEGFCKIGITSLSIKERYSREQTEYDIIYSKKFNTFIEAEVFEQNIKEYCKSYKYIGERIFKITNNTEIFKTEKILEYFK